MNISSKQESSSTIWTAIILSISLNSTIYVCESMENPKIEKSQSSKEILLSNYHKESMISDDEEGALLAKDFIATTISNDSSFEWLTMEDGRWFKSLATFVHLLDILKSKCIMTGKWRPKLFKGRHTGNFRVLADAVLPLRCAFLILKPLLDQTHPSHHHNCEISISCTDDQWAIIIIFQNGLRMNFTPPRGKRIL